MLRPVTVNLVMADDEIEVSQAIPMGKHTGVDVSVTVHNCSASALDLRVYFQGSDDLDHWTNCFQMQITDWPSSKAYPVTYPSQLSCAFGRLKYENGPGSTSGTVIFSVDVNLVEL